MIVFRNLFIAILLLFSISLQARVIDIHWDSRDTVLGGQSFGEYGAYVMLKGKITFGTAPQHPNNQRIVDLQYAPVRVSNGLIESFANIVVLTPADTNLARKIALVEVSNRGGKFSMSYFNRATDRSLAADNAASLGDGLLMKQGLTIIWVGWQCDVPPENDALRLGVPMALLPGDDYKGLVRSDWVIDETVHELGIGHRNLLPYPVANIATSTSVLTVRNHREAPREIVPKDQWQFARMENGQLRPDSTRIYSPTGFQAGNIYELVYQSNRPRVVGLGMAAIRDIIAYAKYDPSCEFPVTKGIAAGVSQTGRFLRHFLYQGFNIDEGGRQAYDGMVIITAGAGRGSFNHRFAQPSRDAHAYSAFFYPTDLFPFTSRPQYDSLLQREEGLLLHAPNRPKTFYINTGYEYWGRAAGLIHTSVDGKTDISPYDTERIYHIASGQHFVDRWPPATDRQLGEHRRFRGNPLEFKVNYRALLVKMVEWVGEEKLPPASCYPKLANGTAVAPQGLAFPALDELPSPLQAHVAYRADYGPFWEKGIVTTQPPRLGPAYPSRVPQVDGFGNELGGIRNHELRVPLATYTPWSLRTGFAGGEDALADFRGMYLPLPRNSTEKLAWNDPRPSVASLYPSQSAYLYQVAKALDDLISEGFVLEIDKGYLLERAKGYWAWVQE